MYFVYALYSEKFDKIYVGFITDVQKRKQAHNDERNSGWTAKFRPWEIIYTEEFDSKSQALKREKQLKTSRERSFIRDLVKY